MSDNNPNNATKYALEYASRGWYVFPIQPNLKVPYKGLKWKDRSTNKPEIINKVAQHPKYQNCNWAIDCNKSGVSIVDVDAYKPHFQNADILNGDRDTFAVKTARGGAQYYYSDPDKRGKNSTEKLAPAIDTRGAGSSGYALIPGSVFENKPYTLSKDAKLLPFPEKIIFQLGEPIKREPNWDIPICELDDELNVKNAITYLEDSAEHAIQGYGGNSTSYKVACRLRDIGISENLAVELLLEHWYDDCTPNNKPEFIEKIVTNAYAYAKKQPGNDTPAAAFPATKSTMRIKCAADINPSSIQPREWLLRYRYLSGYVTVTIAPGGTGKSALTILEGLSVASGKQLCHHKIEQKGAVWLYNTEDPFDELQRRVIAVARLHKLNRVDMENFFYSSAYSDPIKFVAYGSGRGRGGSGGSGHEPVVNEKLVQSVIAEIKKRNVKLFIIDPFVETHSVNENDNTSIAVVAQCFRRIAAESGCAVSLVHHTSKTGSGAGAEESARGNADKSRGASSLVSASRVTNTLYHMSMREAKEYGVSDGMRSWYVRLDHAKDNLSPPNSTAFWYKKHAIGLVFDRSVEDETTVALGRTELESVKVADVEDVYTDFVENLMGADVLGGSLGELSGSEGGSERSVGGSLGELSGGLSQMTVYEIGRQMKLGGVAEGSLKTICRTLEKVFKNVVRKGDSYYELRLVKSGQNGQKVKSIVKTKVS